MNRYGAILSIGLIVAGCASTQMTSVTDTAGKGKHYQSFIVLAKITDLDLRGQVERRVVERLQEAGVEGFASMDLLPPTREYNENEITERLWARDIEGFLVLSVKESRASRVPGSSTAEDRNRPSSALQSELFDVLWQRRVWVSTARTKDGDAATFKTIAPVCDKIVKQLSADNLLSRKGQRSPS